MHSITINDNTIDIPGNWNELTGSQLLWITKLVSRDIGFQELKLKMLFRFSGIRVILRKSILIKGIEHFWIKFNRKEILISPSTLAFITGSFDCFFQGKSDNKWIVNSTLTKQLLPRIRIKGRYYYGPADGLSNITFREFIFTETYLNAYNTTDDIKNVDNLIAVLYRPSGKIKENSINYNGDKRERFNDNIIDIRAKKMTFLPDEYKQAILYYYEGCKKHIFALFPNVFSEGGGNITEKSTFEIFMDIVDELANNEPSKHEQTLDVMLYSALQSLDQRVIKMKNHVKV